MAANCNITIYNVCTYTYGRHYIYIHFFQGLLQLIIGVGVSTYDRGEPFAGAGDTAGRRALRQFHFSALNIGQRHVLHTTALLRGVHFRRHGQSRLGVCLYWRWRNEVTLVCSM